MRLIGLGVIAMLLFAFVALLVDSDSGVLDNVGFDLEVGKGVVVLETLDAQMPKNLRSNTRFPIVEFDQWTALAGFSSQQQLVLPLPRSTTFDSAVVSIDLKAELGPLTNGRLKFSINDTNRGEVVLKSGVQDMTVQIPLSSIERKRDFVSIIITAVGTAPKAECTDNWTGGVVVKIEPTTHLSVNLTEELTDTLDRLLASGSPARIVWDGVSDPNDSSAAYLVPWQWQPFLLRGVFVDAANARATDVPLSLEQLTVYRKFNMDRLRALQRLEGNSTQQWPVNLAKAFGENRSRNFRNQTNWSYRYLQTDLPRGNLPDTLNLDLLAQSSVEKNGWLVVVKLNDNILLSDVFPPTSDRFTATVELPISAQGPENELVITLTSDEKKEGHRVQGVPAVAQLNDGTTLNWSGSDSNPLYKGLLAAATSEVDLIIADSLTAEEANYGFYTMSDVFRSSSLNQIQFEGGERTENAGLILMLNQQSYDKTAQYIGTRMDEVWITYAIIGNGPKPEIKAFKGDDPLLGEALEVHQPASILLVGPPGFEL